MRTVSYAFLFVFVTAASCVLAQTVAQPDFQVYYTFSGMGSNRGTAQPVLRVKGNAFTVTREQTSSYWKPVIMEGEEPVVEQPPKRDTLSKGILRSSTVDSILALVSAYGDSSVFRSNPCIMSGGIYYLTIVRNTDTVDFTLMNTFDTTALQVVSLLMPYLPEDQRLHASEKLLAAERKCWEYHNEGLYDDKQKRRKSKN